MIPDPSPPMPPPDTTTATLAQATTGVLRALEDLTLVLHSLKRAVEHMQATSIKLVEQDRAHEERFDRHEKRFARIEEHLEIGPPPSERETPSAKMRVVPSSSSSSSSSSESSATRPTRAPAPGDAFGGVTLPEPPSSGSLPDVSGGEED